MAHSPIRPPLFALQLLVDDDDAAARGVVAFTKASTTQQANPQHVEVGWSDGTNLRLWGRLRWIHRDTANEKAKALSFATHGNVAGQRDTRHRGDRCQARQNPIVQGAP